MPPIHPTTEPTTTSPLREEAFWKSLPLSKHYQSDHIDHAARLLSAIANADYSNPIPLDQSSCRPSFVISLPRLLPGASVAVFNGIYWRLGAFQKLDAGFYVVSDAAGAHVGCDDVTDVDDADSETEEIHAKFETRMYHVRGSHLRILCERVVYDDGENVMAVFPGGTTFYSGCIVGKCDGEWIVKFDEEERDEPAAVGRLIHPGLIFKA